MSERALRKAAGLKDPRIGLQDRITLLLIADRADDKGRYACADDDALYGEMAKEANAIVARLRGDDFLRFGVDQARVSRVVAILKDIQDR